MLAQPMLTVEDRESGSDGHHDADDQQQDTQHREQENRDSNVKYPLYYEVVAGLRGQSEVDIGRRPVKAALCGRNLGGCRKP